MLLAAPLPVSARTLAELEKALVRQPPHSTTFVEYRFSRLMTRAAIASGTLEFREAGVWVRSVEKPRAERAEIVDGEIHLTRTDGSERRIPLARAPQLRLLLESLRALLEGRISRMEDSFEITLVARESAWGLRLAPRDPALARKVAHIDVFGRDDAPACIEMVEPGGAASLTLLATTPVTAPTDRHAIEARCRTVAIEDNTR